MKKIALAAVTLSLCTALGAQNYTDALRYSDNTYLGTARTLAMGNAFTALGGDLGSLGINPAGSAVARYTQFSLTLGPDISISRTQGNTMPDGTLGFGKKMRTTKGAFDIPNVGGMINFNTGRNRGLKNWAIGFVINGTSTYTSDTYAKGVNTTTSAFGQLAAHATDLAEAGVFTSADLGSTSAYDNLGFSYYDIIAAYRSGAIGAISDKEFIGASEYATKHGEDTSISTGPSGTTQHFGRTVTGGKSDYIVNFGFNFSDIVYIGANLGFVSLNYRSNEYFKEEAVEVGEVPAIFPTASSSAMDTTFFKSARKGQEYRASGSGAYGKFGIIVTPWKGLRLGAAIQTPTLMTIKERIWYTSEAAFENAKYGGSVTSPEGTFEYVVKSPMRANFGAAMTLGNWGVISADYELTNYRKMQFRVPGTSDNSDFENANGEITDLCGVQHYVRLGAEVKPISKLAIRAGYTAKSSGVTYQYNGSNGLDKIAKVPYTHSASFGLGYSSNGSFFADLAAVCYIYPKSYVTPYADYIFDDVTGNPDPYTPEIICNSKLVKIVATVGWRF